MDNALENLLKYFMTLVAAGAVLWKGIDAWEKRKTVQTKELDARIEKVEDCCHEMKEEVKGIKANATNTLDIVLTYFRK